MKKEMILFLLIFLLASFLRLYQINIIPPGLHGDEAQSGIEALKILKGALYSPYSTEVYGQTTLYFYLVAGVIKLFGPSPTAIRLTSALLGIITIPLFYIFVRYFLGKKVALLSAFFLAISRWHIYLSRLGLMSITTTLFQVGTFLFLLKGIKTKNFADFLLAGIFLTLGLNSYMAFRFVPLILLALIVYLAVSKRKLLRKNILGLSLFLITTLILSLPLLFYAFDSTNIFMGRINSIFIFNNHSLSELPAIILENLKGVTLMFNIRGSTWPHKNLPGAPMLDLITGLVFLVGLGLAIYRVKKPFYFLLLINLLIMLSISVFSEPIYPAAGDPIRSNGVIISVFTFAGVGAYTIWGWLRKPRFVLIPFLAATFLLNFQAYFVDFARDPAVWHDFHFVPAEVAKVANSNPNAHLYLLSDWFYSDYLSIRFLSPAFSGEDFFHQLGKYTPKGELLPLKENLDKDSLFIVLPFYNQYLERLKEVYPEGEINDYHRGPENKLIFSSFFVPQKVAGARAEEYE